MKGKFDRWMLALTFLLSGAGCAACAWLYGRMAQDDWGKILWTGLFFCIPFVVSLLGSFLAEGIHRRNFVIFRRGNRAITLIAAALTGFAVGAGGQFLYMLPPMENHSAVDMVLLLDGSGSMQGKKEPCVQATEALLEQMDEQSRAQAVAFASCVLGNTELLPLDEEGRETLIKFVEGTDIIGGTEFGQPLTFALNSLEEKKETGRIQAVILLSDGEGPFQETLEEEYKEKDVVLYTIRMDAGEQETETARQLVQFAQKTGGFDTKIPVDEKGQISTDELTKAFRQAFSAAKEFGMGEGMLVFGKIKGSFLLRFLIRALIFSVCGILVGAVYYRRLNKEQAIGNAAAGLVLCVLVTVLGQIGVGSLSASCVLFCVFIFSAYTTYDLDEEVDGHV